MNSDKSLLDRILHKFARLFYNRTFIIWTGGRKYLQRTYIKRKGFFPEIFIHKFYASDSDRDLHNHPWNNAFSLILNGSYREERFVDNTKTKTFFKTLKPGMFNYIGINDYHRVSLMSEYVWTLFVAFKRVQHWGFWEKNKFVPWEEYAIETKGNFITDLDGNITSLPE